MKRALVFLLTAPVLIAAATALQFVNLFGRGTPSEYAATFALAAFVFTFLVSVFAYGLDAWLTRHLPVAPRAGLTAAGGAIVAGGLAAFMVGCVLPQSAIVVDAIGGALCAGVCSLLANDYGWRETAAQTNGLLHT